MNPENIHSPKEVLTNEKLEELLIGDYPQHSALYVLANLDNVADGTWDEKKFFEKINLDFIKDTKQYIEKFCQTRNLETMGQLDGKTKEISEKIDVLVKELKNAITNKESLKTIYSIVKKFESEIGIQMQTIEIFE